MEIHNTVRNDIINHYRTQFKETLINILSECKEKPELKKTLNLKWYQYLPTDKHLCAFQRLYRFRYLKHDWYVGLDMLYSEIDKYNDLIDEFMSMIEKYYLVYYEDFHKEDCFKYHHEYSYWTKFFKEYTDTLEMLKSKAVDLKILYK